MVSEIQARRDFPCSRNRWLKSAVVSSQRFKLFTREGREIPVISGSVPPHLTRGSGGPVMPQVADIVLTAALQIRQKLKATASVQETRSFQTVLPFSQSTVKMSFSKAWDNSTASYGQRIGSGLSGQELENQIYVGANVQEEVGLR